MEKSRFLLACQVAKLFSASLAVGLLPFSVYASSSLSSLSPLSPPLIAFMPSCNLQAPTLKLPAELVASGLGTAKLSESRKKASAWSLAWKLEAATLLGCFLS